MLQTQLHYFAEISKIFAFAFLSYNDSDSFDEFLSKKSWSLEESHIKSKNRWIREFRSRSNSTSTNRAKKRKHFPSAVRSKWSRCWRRVSSEQLNRYRFNNFSLGGNYRALFHSNELRFPVVLKYAKHIFCVKAFLGGRAHFFLKDNEIYQTTKHLRVMAIIDLKKKKSCEKPKKKNYIVGVLWNDIEKQQRIFREGGCQIHINLLLLGKVNFVCMVISCLRKLAANWFTKRSHIRCTPPHPVAQSVLHQPLKYPPFDGSDVMRRMKLRFEQVRIKLIMLTGLKTDRIKTWPDWNLTAIPVMGAKRGAKIRKNIVK